MHCSARKILSRSSVETLIVFGLLAVVSSCNSDNFRDPFKVTSPSGQDVTASDSRNSIDFPVGHSCSSNQGLAFGRMDNPIWQKLQVARGRQLNITYSFYEHKRAHQLGLSTLLPDGTRNFIVGVETPFYSTRSYNNPSEEPFKKTVRESLNKIAQHVPICFIELNDPEEKAAIRYLRMPYDGAFIGMGHVDRIVLSNTGGALHPQVLLHEAMHSIGVGHSTNSSAVMFAGFNGVSTLTKDDIDGLQALFGQGKCGVTVDTLPTSFKFIKPQVLEVTNTTARIQWTGVSYPNGHFHSLPPEYKIEVSSDNGATYIVAGSATQDHELTARLANLKPGKNYFLRISTTVQGSLNTLYNPDYLNWQSAKATGSETLNDTLKPIVTRDNGKNTIRWVPFPGAQLKISRKNQDKIEYIATLVENQNEIVDPLGIETTLYNLQVLNVPRTYVSDIIQFKTADDNQNQPMLYGESSRKLTSVSQFEVMGSGANSAFLAVENSNDGSNLHYWKKINPKMPLDGVDTTLKFPGETIGSVDHFVDINKARKVVLFSNSQSKCIIRFLAELQSGKLEVENVIERESFCGTPQLADDNLGNIYLLWLEKGSKSISLISNIQKLDLKLPVKVESVYTKWLNPVKNIIDFSISKHTSRRFITLSYQGLDNLFYLDRQPWIKKSTDDYYMGSIQLAKNVEAPFHLASVQLADKRNFMTYTNATMPLKKIGAISIGVQGLEEDPYSAYSLTHDRSEFDVINKRHELLDDGRILSFGRREFVIYSNQGVQMERLTFPTEIESIEDWNSRPTGTRIVGHSIEGDLVVCKLGQGSKCVPLVPQAIHDRILGSPRFHVDSNGDLYIVETYQNDDQKFVSYRKAPL